jgi:SAM-dependent methyltransferase
MAHAAALPMPHAQRDLLLHTARARLYPSLTDPNFLVLRSRRLIFQEWITHLDGQDLTILDVGGRYQPYRPLFEQKTGRYIACDILRTELVDIVGSGESLPFADNTFDVVIATQVFEYISQPHKAAQQAYAVLKPGGCLMMSVASVAPRFGDDECWRFTPKGIREILSGFSQITIAPELLSLGGLIRTMNLAASTLAGFRTLKSATQLTICPLLNLVGLGFEALQITNDTQFTPNYSVLAIK